MHTTDKRVKIPHQGATDLFRMARKTKVIAHDLQEALDAGECATILILMEEMRGEALLDLLCCHSNGIATSIAEMIAMWDKDSLAQLTDAFMTMEDGLDFEDHADVSNFVTLLFLNLLVMTPIDAVGADVVPSDCCCGWFTDSVKVATHYTYDELNGLCCRFMKNLELHKLEDLIIWDDLVRCPLSEQKVEHIISHRDIMCQVLARELMLKNHSLQQSSSIP